MPHVLVVPALVSAGTPARVGDPNADPPTQDVAAVPPTYGPWQLQIPKGSFTGAEIRSLISVLSNAGVGIRYDAGVLVCE